MKKISPWLAVAIVAFALAAWLGRYQYFVASSYSARVDRFTERVEILQGGKWVGTQE